MPKSGLVNTELTDGTVVRRFFGHQAFTCIQTMIISPLSMMSVFLKSMILQKEWTWQIILLLTLHACPLVRFSEKFLAVVKYDFQRGKKYQKAQNAGQLAGELQKLKNAVQKHCKRLI